MKKVLFVNTTFGLGGAVQVAKDLWEHLNVRDNYAAYFAYGRGPEPVAARAFKFGYGFEIYLHALLTRLFGIEGWGTYWSTRRLIRYIKRERFDVIHLHNIHGYYLDFGCLFRFLKKADIPVVWTLHDEWPLSSLRAHTMGCRHCRTGKGVCTSTYTYPKALLHALSLLNLRRKQRAFSGLSNMMLVLPARWLEESVRDSFLAGYRGMVIPNGVDINLFQPAGDKAQLRRQLALPTDKKIVLFSAHRLQDVNKGTAHVLEAARMLRHRPYLFLGIGQGAVASSGNVRVFGLIESREELARFYAAADLFCFPSLAETSPLSVLEAMASGLPVAGFAIPALKEIVRESQGTLVSSHDEAALVSAIETTLADEGALAGKSRAARARIMDAFARDRFFEAHLHLYESL